MTGDERASLRNPGRQPPREPSRRRSSDAELQGGVLTVDGDDGTWVVNKHAPTRQIWLSSPKSGARHYAFDQASGLWKDTRGSGDLLQTLAGELGVPLAWQPE